MGSLPQTTPSFVDPTPYLGVADLSPAFMNPFELENVASLSGTTSLNPAFMNQRELTPPSKLRLCDGRVMNGLKKLMFEAQRGEKADVRGQTG